MVEDKGMTSSWLPIKAMTKLEEGYSSAKHQSTAMHMINPPFLYMLEASSLEMSAELLLLRICLFILRSK